MNKKHRIAVEKIEKLYQVAMNLRDSTPGFVGNDLLERIYVRQYMRAFRITHDVAQFAWETRLYNKLQRTGGTLASFVKDSND